jgi:hypothetical protein
MTTTRQLTPKETALIRQGELEDRITAILRDYAGKITEQQIRRAAADALQTLGITLRDAPYIPRE